MKTQIRLTIWIAFFGLFLAGIGGMVSTSLTFIKPHYPDLIAHLEGGPVWIAFGQEVTVNNIYWGYAYSGPLSITFWALVMITAVKAAPSIQSSRAFLGVNVIGTMILLYFLVAHLLLVGQVLIAFSLIGFVLACFQSKNDCR